jgi:hypothetical protein
LIFSVSVGIFSFGSSWEAQFVQPCSVALRLLTVIQQKDQQAIACGRLSPLESLQKTIPVIANEVKQSKSFVNHWPMDRHGSGE